MNFTSIRYFIEAAKYENFTLASRNLYIAQPNLSKRISTLEAEIGVLLFVRDCKTVRLTSAGKYFYKEFSSILGEAELAINETQSIQRQETNTISIGILDGQELNHTMLNCFESFSKKYPNVELQLARNSFSHLRNGLQSGLYDMIITLDFESNDYLNTDSSIVQLQLSAIAVNKNNPIANVEHLSLKMLKDEDFVIISSKESPQGYAASIKTCKEHGFHPHIVRQANSLENLLLCVELGIGIAVLDENIRLEASSHIRIIPLDFANVNIIACWRRSTTKSMVNKLAEILSPVI